MGPSAVSIWWRSGPVRTTRRRIHRDDFALFEAHQIFCQFRVKLVASSNVLMLRIK